MKTILNYLKSHIPFEIKRPTSTLSLVLTLIIIGFLGKIGETLFDFLLSVATPYMPQLLELVRLIITYSIPVNINIFTITVFIIIFFPAYRFFDKTLLQRLGIVTIFDDDFAFGNRGWNLNYWGSHNPDKTCRFEDSVLVFEAEESEIIESRKEYGAYFDLVNGIYEKSKYEVSCWVKSEKSTNMGFKLWVHDTKGKNEVKFPANFYTPGHEFEEIKVGFIGTRSQGLRIHLHNKAGKGKIIVDRVKVIKVK